jgi:CO dehydrogenase/acetyl-CoA synthase delta subunit
MPIATDTALVLAGVPLLALAVPVATKVVRDAVTGMTRGVVTVVTREAVTEVTGVTRGVVMVDKGEKYANSSSRQLTTM